MTRETKIGMLVGMGVIVAAAILISDYLAGNQRSGPAEMSQLEAGPNGGRDRSAVAMRVDPLPTPGENQTGGGPLNDLRDSRDPRQTNLTEGDRAVQPTPPLHTNRRESVVMPMYEYGTIGIEPRRERGETPRIGEGFTPDRLVTGEIDATDNRVTDDGDLVHYVVEGDTLVGIAKRYYGDADYAQAIYEANRTRMNSPDEIRVGVRLIIPNRAGRIAVAPPSRGEGVEPAPPTPRTYVMQDGDTLSEVAQRLLGSSSRWQDIHQLNKSRIRNPDRVPVGTELQLPPR